MPDLNANDVESAMRVVAGTKKNMALRLKDGLLWQEEVRIIAAAKLIEKKLSNYRSN